LDGRLEDSVIRGDVRFTGYLNLTNKEKLFGRIVTHKKKNLLYQGPFQNNKIHGKSVKICSDEYYETIFEGSMFLGEPTTGHL
jgi:hypothetical protein